MYFYSTRLLLLLLISGASCTSPADQPAVTTPPLARPTAPTPVAPPSPATAASQSQPVSLAGQTLRLKAFPVRTTAADTPPQFSIYLYPSQRPDSVLVTQDTEPSVLDRDQGSRMGVPAAAVLVFQTYYAGGGYHYYVQVDGNKLQVYRRLLEEATPQMEHTSRPQWQPFKTFRFFTEGVRTSTP